MVAKTFETFLVNILICCTEFEGSRPGLGIKKVNEASATGLPSSDISSCQIDKLVYVPVCFTELATCLYCNDNLFHQSRDFQANDREIRRVTAGLSGSASILLGIQDV